MRSLLVPLTALAMLAWTGQAFARCPLYLPMRVGPVTGNPEKDTVGLFCAQPEPDRPAASIGGSRPAARVGAMTGEAEKDSVGFVAAPDGAQAAR
ncbi:hypothetical protein FF100_32590 [Methylobacterium terricola]|uniref:Uncharacterized protein n=1 Tax=Methylobacterium terricola TaxID=2583531 RepID=A0A5C4L9F4_9HYPH|nr:hypothetical protein [Methylobacterium terricola]TNC07338.1 hypothetical protein FF100_32590 [Methylobacterium terricola]